MGDRRVASPILYKAQLSLALRHIGAGLSAICAAAARHGLVVLLAILFDPERDVPPKQDEEGSIEVFADVIPISLKEKAHCPGGWSARLLQELQARS